MSISRVEVRQRIMMVLRWGFRSIEYILSLIVCLLFVFVAWSPLVPPMRFTLPALLGLFFPAFVLMMLCVTVYWLIRRQWRILLMLFGVWLLGWPAIHRYVPLNRSSASNIETSRATKRLKVLSYNVAAFGFVKHTSEQPNPILQYLKSSGADIICLQEAMVSAHLVWASISAKHIRTFLKDDYPYIHIGQAQERGSTLVLLSKYPIRSNERLPMASWANGAIAYELEVEGRRLALINAHLESFHLSWQDGQSYVDYIKQANAKGLSQALLGKLAPAYQRRNVQVNLLHGYIQRRGAEDVILCGDFNDTPISYTHYKLSELLEDAFTARGSGFGFSYNKGIFVVRIDHIMTGSNLATERVYIDHSITVSDHSPIVAHLAWTPSEVMSEE